MCELLALNFNQPVQCALSFRGFASRSYSNPDGWGIASYEGRACQVIKEPIRASDSPLACTLRDSEALCSTIIIGHVRRASTGNVALCNTHPFVRVFRRREVVLAHNGTLDDEKLKEDGVSLRFHPVGQTDSELLLCRLLTELSQQSIAFDDYPAIHALLRRLNRYGSMNVLFSDSERLFAYRDANGWNQLWCVERAAPFPTVSLRDEEWEVDLASEKDPRQRGFVIATRPLTDGETWREIPKGALWIFSCGQLVYTDDLVAADGHGMGHRPPAFDHT